MNQSPYTSKDDIFAKLDQQQQSHFDELRKQRPDLTEEQIREVMADTYENYETRAAIKALAHHVYQIQNAGPGL